MFGFLKSKRKVFVLGLDGFPCSLARKLIDEGRMPNLQRLAQKHALKEICSVYPTVSNVAWASFQTGVPPAEFGIFGFVQLQRDLGLSIPKFSDLKAETLWEKASAASKPFVSLSVPMTYPAPPVKGQLVSGFLAPQLDARAVSNPDFLGKLSRTGYEIDIDPGVAAHSLEQFQCDLLRVHVAREKTILNLMETEDWDFFVAHVMDTDRINHFMWKYQYEPESPKGRFFLDFYQRVDMLIGEVVERLDKNTELMILSDHGFCDLKSEVQLNRWLRQEGFLDYADEPARMFQAIRPGSRAVSMVPGRIYILTRDDWDIGCVTPQDYAAVRDKIVARLRELRHPATGEAVCKNVFTKDQVFAGPHAAGAPDIFVEPVNGCDLKARLGEGGLFGTEHLNGMHTYDDAMLLMTEHLAEGAPVENITQAGRRLREYVLG